MNVVHCIQLSFFCHPLYCIYTLQRPLAELVTTGHRFSSSDLTRTTDDDNFSGNATATAFLPPSLFQLITDYSEVGTTFIVYDTGVLFPITSRMDRTNSSVRTVIGSPVLGILVGLGLTFSRLVDPVSITLQLQQKDVGMKKK